MRELRELRRYRQGRVLATCVKHRHAVRMATQKTQIRQRLGAEVARLRDKAGMSTQADLAKAASLGLRSVWAVENGEKVAPRTLRKIEAALRLPPGAIDEFLEKQLDHLPEQAATVRTSRETLAELATLFEDLATLDEVLRADLDELRTMARMMARFLAKQEKREPRVEDEKRFMRWALQTQDEQGRDIKAPGRE